MRFVETHVFTATIRRHLDDERYRQLQIALMLRPEQGPIIQGREACGKSGGRPPAGVNVAACASSTTGHPAIRPSTWCTATRNPSRGI